MAVRLAPMVLMGPFVILAVAMASPMLAAYLIFGTGGGGIASGSLVRSGVTLGAAAYGVVRGAAKAGIAVGKRTPAGKLIGAAKPVVSKAKGAIRGAMSRLRK